MTVKTTLTLDNKADYDLLVRTLVLRLEDLVGSLANSTSDRRPGERRAMSEERTALENLIKQVT